MNGRKAVSFLLAAVMALISIQTVTAKSPEDYAQERVAVIADGTVDMHHSMTIDGSVLSTGEIRTDISWGNEVKGKLISGTVGDELIYWEGNPDTFLTEGYKLYDPNGGKLTAYQANLVYEGAIFDDDVQFPYEVGPSLFEIPAVSEYDYDKVDANEWSNNIFTISGQMSIQMLTVAGNSVIIDATEEPVLAVIDTLKMESTASQITVEGDKPVYLFVRSFDVEGGRINVKEEENGNEVCSENVTFFVSDIKKFSHLYIAGDMYIDSNEIEIDGSGTLIGNIVTNAREIELAGSSTIYGVVMAPEAEAEIKGGSTIYGRLISKELDIGGRSNIFYDEDIINDFDEMVKPGDLVPQPEPTIEPTAEPAPEPDVPSYTKPYEIGTAAAYIYGRTDTEMEPDDWMLRGEVASVMYRLLRQNHKLSGFVYRESAEPMFIDIAGRWDRSALEFLTYLGIYSNEKRSVIGPTETITRGEAFQVFCIALGMTDDTTLTRQQYTNILKEAGYVQGDENGNLNVNSFITRAEMCKIYNMMTGRDSAALQTADGEAVTAETYGLTDIAGHWAEKVMLRATSAFDGNGYVDPAARANRNDLDDYNQ